MHPSYPLPCFLGANSPCGFVSQFEKAYDPEDGWRVYILKGGPGTGKSSLMKRLAGAAADLKKNCHLAYCSADPGSADAVILPDDKIMVADGTAPQAMVS
ncbi:MAG: hypothetical protein IJL87_00965 [Clostridia bacterium]|nr:hypothetical protein [Clostridia bacterium]